MIIVQVKHIYHIRFLISCSKISVKHILLMNDKRMRIT